MHRDPRQIDLEDVIRRSDLHFINGRYAGMFGAPFPRDKDPTLEKGINVITYERGNKAKIVYIYLTPEDELFSNAEPCWDPGEIMNFPVRQKASPETGEIRFYAIPGMKPECECD